MRSEVMRGLVLHAAAGLGGSVVLSVVIFVAGFRPSPAPFLLLGMTVGALIWLIRYTPRSAPKPEWVLPRAPAYAARFTADLQTRRLASLVVGAQPGRAFTMGELAATLRARVEERLIRRGVPSDDPLARAEAHLSPELYRYLLNENPPALPRRAVRAFLKEIEEL